MIFSGNGYEPQPLKILVDELGPLMVAADLKWPKYSMFEIGIAKKSSCQKLVEWINGNGGSAEWKVG